MARADDDLPPDRAIMVRIEREMYDAIRERAFKEHRPMSELIREALQKHYNLPT